MSRCLQPASSPLSALSVLSSASSLSWHSFLVLEARPFSSRLFPCLPSRCQTLKLPQYLHLCCSLLLHHPQFWQPLLSSIHQLPSEVLPSHLPLPSSVSGFLMPSSPSRLLLSSPSLLLLSSPSLLLLLSSPFLLLLSCPSHPLPS